MHALFKKKKKKLTDQRIQHKRWYEPVISTVHVRKNIFKTDTIHHRCKLRLKLKMLRRSRFTGSTTALLGHLSVLV